MKELMKTLEAKEERMIAIRRHLHAHPELSFEEERTAAFIVNFYEGVPVDSVETDFGGQRGVVVTIKGAKPGRTIAIRADFDALPIQEETGLPHASKVDGVMHACGHDGHTAYMLVLAETLARNEGRARRYRESDPSACRRDAAGRCNRDDQSGCA